MKALTSIGYRRSGSPRCHSKSRLVRSPFVVECCPEPGLDILGVLVARASLVDWNPLICREPGSRFMSRFSVHRWTFLRFIGGSSATACLLMSRPSWAGFAGFGAGPVQQ